MDFSKSKTMRDKGCHLKNRTLDNYPMSHGKGDAMKSVRGQQADKRDYARKMSRARTDSGSLSDYSKRMFDFSVSHSADRTNGCETPRSGGNESADQGSSLYRARSGASSRRPKSRMSSASSGTNGPTVDGSILHNQKQKVLNNIRIRAFNEFDTHNHRARSCPGSNLQETIQEKTRHFRLLSHPSHQSSQPCSSRPRSMAANSTSTDVNDDVIFIPLNTGTSYDYIAQQFSDLSRACTFDTALSEYMDSESVTSHDPFDDADQGSVSIDGEFRPLSQSTRPNSSVGASAMLSPTTTVCNIRLVSLDEEMSSSESEHVEDEAPRVEQQVEVVPRAHTADGKKREPNIRQGSRKGKDVLPEPPPTPVKEKVKVILKGPHCWVDDATISSDESEHDDVIPEVPPPPPEAVPEPVPVETKPDIKSNKKGLGKRPSLKRQKTIVIVEPKIEPVIPEPVPVLPEPLAPVVTEEPEPEEEEEDMEPTLPTYICPSSEKKSRETALKDWLASTCFHTGYRHAPVL